MRYFSFEDTLRELPLTNVHHESQCDGRDCILHNPSRHNLVLSPFHFIQSEVIFMYRTCPHEEPHIDPDALGYLSRNLSKHTVRNYLRQTDCANNACCGCCGWKD